MKKLLDKTTLYSTTFSVMLLLLSAPLFYMLIDHLNTSQVDETLSHKKDDFTYNYLPHLDTNNVATWNALNQDFRL